MRSLLRSTPDSLKKRNEDLATIHERVLKAHYSSVAQFEKDYTHTIRDYNFSLVLVRNSRVENEHSRKTKPCYLGPMIVIKRTRNRVYILAELTSAIAKLPYAGFRLIPYYPQSHTHINITSLVDPADISADEESVEEMGE
jgi:hypothetical protein